VELVGVHRFEGLLEVGGVPDEIGPVPARMNARSCSLVARAPMPRSEPVSRLVSTIDWACRQGPVQSVEDLLDVHRFGHAGFSGTG
jgi:hypothetical protein